MAAKKKTETPRALRAGRGAGGKPKPKTEKAPAVSRVASTRSTRRGGRGR